MFWTKRDVWRWATYSVGITYCAEKCHKSIRSVIAPTREMDKEIAKAQVIVFLKNTLWVLLCDLLMETQMEFKDEIIEAVMCLECCSVLNVQRLLPVKTNSAEST